MKTNNTQKLNIQIQIKWVKKLECATQEENKTNHQMVSLYTGLKMWILDKKQHSRKVNFEFEIASLEAGKDFEM